MYDLHSGDNTLFRYGDSEFEDVGVMFQNFSTQHSRCIHFSSYLPIRRHRSIRPTIRLVCSLCSLLLGLYAIVNHLLIFSAFRIDVQKSLENFGSLSHMMLSGRPQLHTTFVRSSLPSLRWKSSYQLNGLWEFIGYGQDNGVVTARRQSEYEVDTCVSLAAPDPLEIEEE